MARNIYIYVTPFFPTPSRHYGSYSYDFVKALMEYSGYDVKVFCLGDGNDYEFMGVTVHTFRTKQLPSSVFPLLFAKWNQSSFLKAVEMAGIDVKDVAVCHGHTAAFSIYPLAVKSLNPICKTLLHHHDLAPCGLLMGKLRYFWPHKVLNWIILRNAMEKIDLHVFISEVAYKSLEMFPYTRWSVYGAYRKLGWGMSFLRPMRMKSSVVIWNGIDTGLFFPRRVVHKGFIIGCSAIYWPLKDHITLMRAVAMLRNKIPGLHLRMIGEPAPVPFGEKIRRIRKELGIEDISTFEEWLPHEKTPCFYNAIDLFVMPSYFEGLGCVYLESLACGTPFVACEGQGIGDLIPEDDRSLWLCRPKDAESLAENIYLYYINRPRQRLVRSVSFSELLPEFLRKVEQL